MRVFERLPSAITKGSNYNCLDRRNDQAPNPATQYSEKGGSGAELHETPLPSVRTQWGFT